jgi:hypothetical protein
MRERQRGHTAGHTSGRHLRPDDGVPRGLLVDLGRVRRALRSREYADDLLELAVIQIEELRDRDPRGFASAREDLIEVVPT